MFLSMLSLRQLISGTRKLVVVGSLLVATAASAQISSNEVVVCETAPYLTWLYSPDARVTGYYVKYGTVDDPVTNVFNANYTNVVDLSLLTPGLALGKTNSVFVTAYDALVGSFINTLTYLHCAYPARAASWSVCHEQAHLQLYSMRTNAWSWRDAPVTIRYRIFK